MWQRMVEGFRLMCRMVKGFQIQFEPEGAAMRVVSGGSTSCHGLDRGEKWFLLTVNN